ncbi:MAG TPA: hypothetical protein VE974_25050 [Thermoanaerobaculia bacterium]|nr:hypothetical protein [Thermoanaerobaculia bacterium]
MQPESQQWYGGRLVTATRELTPDERLELAELLKNTKRSLKQTAFIGFLALVVLVASVVTGRLLGFFGLVAILYSFRRRFAGARAELQFVRTAEGDLAEGRVGICGNIEVLLASCLIWTWKGERQAGITLLTRASTAPVPEHAHLAMNYVKPFDDSVSVHQRPLSDAEVAELTTYAPDVPIVRGLFGALTVAAALVALSAVPRYPPVIVASIAICLFVTWRIARGLLAVMRVRREVLRDTADRYVVIVRRTEDNQLFEVLPHSHYVWTEGGEPADWRRS